MAQKYLVFVRNTPAAHQSPSATPMKEMMAAFSAWREKYAAEIVDMGGKLKPSGKVVRTSGITDGPFAEAKEVVGGYMVVAADNYEHAIQIASGCPGIVNPGSTLEIREIATS
jgi:hypothetical protein